MNFLPYKILKIILALCLATPLLAFSGVIFPYTVPKVFAFRVLVEIAAVFCIFLVLKYSTNFFTTSYRGGQREQSPSLFKGRLGGILNLSILAFFVLSFFSALFGADFYTSFWGNLERGMGVFSLLHFVVFFFILQIVFRSHEEWIPLIKASVFVSAAVSFLAICQHFFSLSDLLPQVDRVYSLIGNAGVLSSYLVFNIFLAGYLFFHELSSSKNSFKKLGYCLLIFVFCLALALSGTRGAWLGLLAGVLIFLAIMAWQSQQKKWRKFAIWGLSIIFVLIASLFIIRDSSFVKNNPTLYRLTSISFSDGTAQSRLILWQGAWQAWQSKPLLGFGSENFETAIGKYISPRLAEFEGYSTDRAHNFIFDYGVTVGWLGLLSYLAIFIVALWKLIENLKNNLIFSSIFISLLAAYLVQNLFIFDSFVSYLMLFFVLALISNTCHSDVSADAEESSKNVKLSFRHLSLFVSCLLYLVSFLLLFVIYMYSLKPLLAARYANQILSLPASEASAAASMLKNVTALNSFASPEITYQVTLDYVDKINQNPALAQNEEFYSVASGELLKIITRSPDQFKNYIALSWLSLYFSGQEKTRVTESLELAQKVRALSPNKKDAYLLLVAGYSLSNQPQKALQAVDQALAIDAKMGEEVKGYYDKLK